MTLGLFPRKGGEIELAVKIICGSDDFAINFLPPRLHKFANIIHRTLHYKKQGKGVTPRPREGDVESIGSLEGYTSPMLAFI